VLTLLTYSLSVSGRAATITPAGISSKHSPPLQWYYYLIANNKLQCGRNYYLAL
jgi:hypothetical protein